MPIITPDFLARQRAHLLQQLRAEHPSFFSQPVAQQNIDLTMRAFQSALESISTVAATSHCSQCGAQVSALALAMLADISVYTEAEAEAIAEAEATTAEALETISPISVLAVNTPEELDVALDAIARGEDPEATLAAYRTRASAVGTKH